MNFIETPLINHYYITVLHPTGQNVFQGFGDRASITTIKWVNHVIWLSLLILVQSAFLVSKSTEFDFDWRWLTTKINRKEVFTSQRL